MPGGFASFKKNMKLIQTFQCPKLVTEMQQCGLHFHCQSCDRKVFDLSQANDNEIAAAFEGKVEICARMPHEKVTPVSFNKFWKFIIAFGMVFLFGLSCDQLMAQEDQHPVEQTYDNYTLMIKGQLTDDEGNPIILATVMLKDSDGGVVYAVGDFDGRYTIRLTEESDFNVESEMVLEFSYIGYQKIQTVVPAGTTRLVQDAVMNVLEGENFTVGLMICVGPPSPINSSREADVKYEIEGEELEQLLRP